MAISELIRLEALKISPLSKEVKITTIGNAINCMQVEPVIGRMLYFSFMNGCTYEAIYICSYLLSRKIIFFSYQKCNFYGSIAKPVEIKKEVNSYFQYKMSQIFTTHTYLNDPALCICGDMLFIVFVLRQFNFIKCPKCREGKIQKKCELCQKITKKVFEFYSIRDIVLRNILNQCKDLLFGIRSYRNSVIPSLLNNTKYEQMEMHVAKVASFYFGYLAIKERLSTQEFNAEQTALNLEIDKYKTDSTLKTLISYYTNQVHLSITEVFLRSYPDNIAVCSKLYNVDRYRSDSTTAERSMNEKKVLYHNLYDCWYKIADNAANVRVNGTSILNKLHQRTMIDKELRDYMRAQGIVECPQTLMYYDLLNQEYPSIQYALGISFDHLH
jgi:HrpA-like RNA helicase